MNQTPEQKARDQIDAQLRQAGWAVQAYKAINLHEGLGQAIREYPTDSGPADYILFLGGRAVGVIEAKRAEAADNLTVVEAQTQRYATAKLKYINSQTPLRFLFESTGTITQFTDTHDPHGGRAREIFHFPRPETVQEWLNQPTTLRHRLQQIPPLNPEQRPAKQLRLRDCQEIAITNLETSLSQNRPRALVHMATGAGKTYTAITMMYRLLKYGGAKRILFLVDTKNLGEQAEQEMMAYTPLDDNRKFTELYSVQRLKSAYVPPNAHVCISTIQRLYAILKGEELNEGSEDRSLFEESELGKQPLPVVYNPKVDPFFFDFIFIDECHRSIYNLWRQVLEYFDAYLMGLTATPDNRTYGFFQKNVVSEYSHEQAVVDGVNVQSEVYLIDTKITQAGATISAQQVVEKRERLTRQRRWAVQDEEESYTGKQLDRDVVNPDQIRTVIRAFREALPRIFPGRDEVPKTLIFAKTDQHANDIIQMVRQEFGQGNAFCKKVTYQSEENPQSILASFRNDYYPRIAVTVDMIATGTDVKPLECLLFMRDVRSKNYFEQMKGRGTRVLEADDLRKVSPSAASAKTHYVIVDAVGVTKSLKSSSPTLVTKPSVSLVELARGVMMGLRDSDTVSSLVGRLARLDKQLTPAQKEDLEKAAGGVSLPTLMNNLLQAIDGDAVEARAVQIANIPPGNDPGELNRQKAQEQLVFEASAPLTGTFISLLEKIRTAQEQTIDHDNLDRLLRSEWEKDIHGASQKLADEFAQFFQTNKDELMALEIFFSEPYRRHELTFARLKEVLTKLKQNKPHLAPERVWQAYAYLENYKGAQPATELTLLVTLIRRVCGLDGQLQPFEEQVRRNFQEWIMGYHAGAGTKFNEAQMAWLHMVRDHICTSYHIEQDDLEQTPFDSKGGLGQMYKLFGAEMNSLLAELNKVLVN